jgi:hypothetical protein
MSLERQAIWFVALLLLLLLARRWMSDSLQRCLLLILRRPDQAVLAYAAVLFPGVFLHETSHWIAARLLGVRVGPIHLVPRVRPGGVLQLGSVEIEAVDPFRSTLIGAAPLLAGLAALTALVRLWPGVGLAWQTFDWTAPAIVRTAQLTAAAPWLGLWFYLAWAVSNTMLPSPSDRRGWLTVLIVIALLLGVSIYLGYGRELLTRVQDPLSLALRSMAGIFGLTIALDMLVSAPLTLLAAILSRLQ